MDTPSKPIPVQYSHESLLTSSSLGPMVETQQGKRLGDEVWKEMVAIFEKEAPHIKGIISAP